MIFETFSRSGQHDAVGFDTVALQHAPDAFGKKIVVSETVADEENLNFLFHNASFRGRVPGFIQIVTAACGRPEFSA